MTSPRQDSYEIVLTPNARKDLGSLDAPTAKRIRRALPRLQQHATDTTWHTMLKVKHSRHYRLQVGKYRVIYDIDHLSKEIVITLIAHRREVYS